MKDYNIYKFSLSERFKYILTAVFASAVISYIFYRSIVFFVVLLPFSFFYPKFITEKLIKKENRDLRVNLKKHFL